MPASVRGPAATAAPLFSWLPLSSSLLAPLTTLNASAAACVALLAAAAAASGFGFAGVLLLLRQLSPAATHLTLPLHFDYSSTSAIAAVDLLDPHGRPNLVAWPGPSPSDGAASSLGPPYRPPSRPRPPPVPRAPDQMEVSVRLRLPRGSGELMQLTGELLSANGQVVAQASRTHLPTATPWLLHAARHVFLAPCYAVGLCSDTLQVELVLFSAYVRREQAPIRSFRATLTSRAGPPPAVHGAEVHIALKTGLLRRLLHLLCPSWPVALSLGSAAVLLSIGASALSACCAAAALALYWLSYRLAWPGQQQEAADEAEGEEGEEEEGEEEGEAQQGALPPAGFSEEDGCGEENRREADGQRRAKPVPHTPWVNGREEAD